MAPASHKTPPYPQGHAHKSQGVTIADIQKKTVHHYTTGTATSQQAG